MERVKFDDIYILDDGEVREFLIIGENEALLIDTGFVYDDILNEVRKITQLPIQVLLTHGDGDHRGGLYQFDECYVHPDDQFLINDQIIIKDIHENDQFNVGKYHFEVITIPGHTPGSIALLDRKEKLLISGDTVQMGPIYMFGERRSIDTYIDSLKKLISLKADIEIILPSHHQYPLTKEYIDYCLEDAIALKNGELLGVPHPKLPCQEYQGQHICFYV